MTATPVPRILPARSEPGRTQASRISTILLDFSSTTPMAMVWPPPMMTMIMASVPMTMRMVVDLPAPLAPTKPTSSWSSRVRDRESRA